MTAKRATGRRRRAGASASVLARLRAARDLTALATAVYVFLAVLVGFAHRPIDPTVFAPTAAQETRLPDGSVAVLCLTGEDRGAPLPHAGSTICDACLIIAAPGLAAAPPQVPPPSFETLKIDRRSAATAPDGIPRLAAHPRGPPSLMTIG